MKALGYVPKQSPYEAWCNALFAEYETGKMKK